MTPLRHHRPEMRSSDSPLHRIDFMPFDLLPNEVVTLEASAPRHVQILSLEVDRVEPDGSLSQIFVDVIKVQCWHLLDAPQLLAAIHGSEEIFVKPADKGRSPADEEARTSSPWRTTEYACLLANAPISVDLRNVGPKAVHIEIHAHVLEIL